MDERGRDDGVGQREGAGGVSKSALNILHVESIEDDGYNGN